MPKHLSLQLAATSLPGETIGRRGSSGGGREQSVSPSLSMPFHTLLSLCVHPPLFFFQIAGALHLKELCQSKKAPANESKCQGAKVSDRTSSKAEDCSDIERQHSCFASRRLPKVGHLYLIWRIDQERIFQFKWHKTSMASRKQDKQYSSWADAVSENSKLISYTSTTRALVKDTTEMQHTVLYKNKGDIQWTTGALTPK